MSKVFVSHSRVDKPLARQLAFDLEMAGHQAWVDEIELEPGGSLDRVLDDILSCDALVTLVSEASARSDWVAAEVTVARRAGIVAIPVLLDDVRPPEGLVDVAHVDLRRPEDYRRGFHRLVAHLESRPPPVYLTATAALRLLERERRPRGRLAGLGQLGLHVATAFSDRTELDTIDAAAGASRFWIIDHLEDDRVVTSLLFDGQVTGRLAHPVVHEPGDSAVMSRVLHVNTRDHWPPDVQTSTAGVVPLEPIRSDFLDSDDAVALALSRQAVDRPGPGTLLLTRLRHETFAFDAPTWTVMQVDRASLETLWAISIRADGAGRATVWEGEDVLLSGLEASETDDGGVLITLDRALARTGTFWRIRDLRTDSHPPVTGAEALAMVRSQLSSHPASRASVLAISNTGTLRPSVSPVVSSPDAALMDARGRAGQWVLELVDRSAGEATQGPDGSAAVTYPAWRVVVAGRGRVLEPVEQPITTPAGFRITDDRTFDEVADALEAAVLAAQRVAPTPVDCFSVSLIRRDPDCHWFFRFYRDKDMVGQVTVSDDGTYAARPGTP